MMAGDLNLAEKLREEFDAGFAEAQREGGAGEREFVLVGSGKLLVALPVEELLGIEHGVEVVPVPSRVPSLLGLAGVRSAVVPVFSLHALMGAAAASGSPGPEQTFALVDDGSGGRVGLGFERLLRFVRVGEQALPRSADGGPGRLLVHEDEMFERVEPRALLQGILRGTAALPGDEAGDGVGGPAGAGSEAGSESGTPGNRGENRTR